MRFLSMIALAALVAGPAAADPFCTAVKTVAAATPTGFKVLRGEPDPAAHTSSFDTYKAAPLPESKACGVVAAGEVKLGPPTFSCEFAAAANPHQQMVQLAHRLADCVGATIPAAPIFKPTADGLTYGFTKDRVRYEVSSGHNDGPAGPLSVNLEIRLPASDD